MMVLRFVNHVITHANNVFRILALVLIVNQILIGLGLIYGPVLSTNVLANLAFTILI